MPHAATPTASAFTDVDTARPGIEWHSVRAKPNPVKHRCGEFGVGSTEPSESGGAGFAGAQRDTVADNRRTD
jgi:hypothetical protein